jgi:hypothetical protein
LGKAAAASPITAEDRRNNQAKRDPALADKLHEEFRRQRRFKIKTGDCAQTSSSLPCAGFICLRPYGGPGVGIARPATSISERKGNDENIRVRFYAMSESVRQRCSEGNYTSREKPKVLDEDQIVKIVD